MHRQENYLDWLAERESDPKRAEAKWRMSRARTPGIAHADPSDEEVSQFHRGFAERRALIDSPLDDPGPGSDHEPQPEIDADEQ